MRTVVRWTEGKHLSYQLKRENKLGCFDADFGLIMLHAIAAGLATAMKGFAICFPSSEKCTYKQLEPRENRTY